MGIEIKQKKLFKVLKKRFTTELILVTLYLDKNMRIEVDGLDYTTREMLFIEFEDGK